MRSCADVRHPTYPPPTVSSSRPRLNNNVRTVCSTYIFIPYKYIYVSDFHNRNHMSNHHKQYQYRLNRFHIKNNNIKEKKNSIYCIIYYRRFIISHQRSHTLLAPKVCTNSFENLLTHFYHPSRYLVWLIFFIFFLFLLYSVSDIETYCDIWA